MPDDTHNYELEPETKPVVEGDLSTVRRLFEQFRSHEAKAAEYEDLASKEHAKALNISDKLLPALMEQIGLDSFTTLDGKTVTIKDVVTASITEANAPAAFKWMRKNGHAELIRRAMKLDFGPGDKNIPVVLATLKKLGITPAADKEGVHPQTLLKMIRDLLSAGESVPMQVFGVRQFKRAEEKTTKGKKAKAGETIESF